VTTGRCVNAPQASVQRFPVRRDGPDVLVDIAPPT
jgi:nitrite reductase/ring-hydroxylating ferredoxin subunit